MLLIYAFYLIYGLNFIYAIYKLKTKRRELFATNQKIADLKTKKSLASRLSWILFTLGSVVCGIIRVYTSTSIQAHPVWYQLLFTGIFLVLCVAALFIIGMIMVQAKQDGSTVDASMEKAFRNPLMFWIIIGMIVVCCYSFGTVIGNGVNLLFIAG